MARSIKKRPVLKDTETKYGRFMRKLSHKRVRLESKRRLNNGDWDTMPLNKELTNHHEICDWKWVVDNDELYEAYLAQKPTWDHGWVDGYQFHRLRYHPKLLWFNGHLRIRK